MYLHLYLFRTSPAMFSLWLGIVLLWGIGGWLVATHAFRLEKHENLIVGFGLGMAGYLVFVNFIGRLLPPTIAFVGGSVLVLAVGLLYAWKDDRPFLDWTDLRVWPILLVGLGVALLATRLEGGLGIFDDQFHLPTVSMLATGDIPPHAYYDSTTLVRYHYAFQLLGASLVRVGGLFPWSAFDVVKAIIWAYTFLLVYLLGRRYFKNSFGVAALLVVFILAGGTRYLLLLVPREIVELIDPQITLIGTSAAIGQPLSRALLEPWTIDGGPPFPVPFAFQNGIFRTFTYNHGNPSAVVFILLLWLLSSRSRHKYSFLAVAGVFSVWALTSETSYALFMIGILFVFLYSRIRQKTYPEGFPQVAIGALVSVPLVLVQGGIITLFARDFLINIIPGGSAAVVADASEAWFGIRWPPAILSAHLGSLRIDSPAQLFVAILEMGPVVLIAPWIVSRAVRIFTKGDWMIGVMIATSTIAFAIPIFLRYGLDTGMVRFSGYAIWAWTILLVIILCRPSSQGLKYLRPLGWTSLGLMVFGGVVLGGLQLTALYQGELTPGAIALDASVSSQVWDTFGDDDDVFDPAKGRATIVTGRPTRIGWFYNLSDEWIDLRDDPSLDKMLESRFGLVYVDEEWWTGLTLEQRESFSAPCVTVAGESSNDRGEFRRLLDLRECAGYGP